MSEDIPQMDPYAIVEALRKLNRGDMIRVWFRRGKHVTAERLELQVGQEIGSERYPLVECWETDVDIDADNRPTDKHYILELIAEHTGEYRLRDLGNPSIDGSTIVAVKRLQLV